jgi:hypothetical protein
MTLNAADFKLLAMEQLDPSLFDELYKHTTLLRANAIF